MTLGSSHAPSLISAAVIAAAHGIRGHVKVKCFLEDPSLLKTYSPFLNEQGKQTYTIDKILSRTKDVLIISLEGVTNRDQAELLKGTQLLFSRERLPVLAEDTFYHDELIGLTVKSPQGQSLGKVRSIYNFGAGELLEIKTLKGNLEMIPFTQQIVPDISVQSGVLHLSTEGELFLTGGLHVS